MKEATNDSVRLTFDTISEDYTYPIILGTITEGKSAKISLLHKPLPEFVEKRKDVEWYGEQACTRSLLSELSPPLRNIHLYRIRTDRQHKEQRGGTRGSIRVSVGETSWLGQRGFETERD